MLKDELRQGKGEFSYMKDWLEEAAPQDHKSMKSMILAVLHEEIDNRVSQMVDARMSSLKKDIDNKIAFMETSIKMIHADKGAKMDGVMGELAKLVAEVGKVKNATSASHSAEGSNAVTATPVAYSADIVRGSDGLISKINLVPKG